MKTIFNKYKYTDKEMEELISSIVILVDTREKVNSHITDYFDRKEIKYKKKALSYGDYSFMISANEKLGILRDLYFTNSCVIERKASLEEISGNLTKERDRFEKELCLALKTKVLLIENASYEDIATGNYDTKYNRKSFIASIHSFWFKYNIPVMFMPNNQYSGLFIREYFEYFLKNYLR
ncbi:ERCC4 domain-containing protein [Coprococcus sp. RTP21281st1_F1_RTP21281_210402]|uniref:ERCC4 domain-containing protein n=1 Tax=Coprococcus sp. RTP21281st1_F1_RTP21281_210402 TaxID=3143208 RepID=UPI0034A355FB